MDFRHASVKNNNEAAICEMSSLADGAGASDHSLFDWRP